MLWVERDLKLILFEVPCHGQGHLSSDGSLPSQHELGDGTDGEAFSYQGVTCCHEITGQWRTISTTTVYSWTCFSSKKILDGRNIHLYYLPLLWKHRSRKRTVTFSSYRWWSERIRFLESGIICMWQARSVSIIYGGNHSITLGAVQSAPHWGTSLTPGVQFNAKRLARDNMLSEQQYNFILFRSKHERVQ